jgi:hypothetical protein
VGTDGAIGDIRRSALEPAALLLLRGRSDSAAHPPPAIANRAKQYGTFGDYGPAPPDRHPDSRNAIDASA